MFATKRLQKELIKIRDHLPPGISLIEAENFSRWILDLRVLDDQNPIYLNQIYRLHFTFSKNYPIEPPEVVFVQDATHVIPMHPHIYSNGIICLDLLAPQGWSPVHSVESVCVSLQSMLTSNSRNERPEGDELFVRTNRRTPREINWAFHDDHV